VGAAEIVGEGDAVSFAGRRAGSEAPLPIEGLLLTACSGVGGGASKLPPRQVEFSM